MDKRGTYFFLGGVSALVFYGALLTLLFLFFNDRSHKKHYVPKQSESIEVSIMQAPPARPKPIPKRPEPPKKETKPMPKPKPKPPAATKPAQSKPAPQNRPRAIASLFKGVKVKQPVETSRPARLANAPKIRYKPKSAPSQTAPRPSAKKLLEKIKLDTDIKISSRSGGQGEVDAYMSKLYKRLYGSWQPDPLYAGLKATVRFRIRPDGTFRYRVVVPSDNQGFNESLIEYLDAMQRMGFPPHKKGKELVIDVEFKAKE